MGVNTKSSIMAALTFILAFLLIGVVSLYFYMRRHHGYLETTGLPVVPAFMCFGSPPYAFHRIHYHEWFTEKFRQLGRTFARYQGVTPCILSIDPEFIKEVTVKQFDNFSHIITTEDTRSHSLISGKGSSKLSKLFCKPFMIM